MAQVLLAYLRDRGVIDLPWPDARWEFMPDARTTPLESLQWRLTWTVYEPALLIDALDDYFDSLDYDDFTAAVHLRLWTDLGSAETERFFEQQLVKHRFCADWAQDIAFVYRESPVVLTLAQWRYCAWAAVRRGASVALQQGLRADDLREAIYQETRRRAAMVANGAWAGCSLAPYRPLPESALGQGFAQRVTRLGALYWTGCPSIEALLSSAAERSGRIGIH